VHSSAEDLMLHRFNQAKQLAQGPWGRELWASFILRSRQCHTVTYIDQPRAGFHGQQEARALPPSGSVIEAQRGFPYPGHRHDRSENCHTGRANHTTLGVRTPLHDNRSTISLHPHDNAFPVSQVVSPFSGCCGPSECDWRLAPRLLPLFTSSGSGGR